MDVIQDTDADITVSHNTGLRLWDGAYLLSKYIENSYDEDFWRGTRCVELGCGCGLVGIVAWLLGAQVTLTDTTETVAHTKKCVDRNVENWRKRECSTPPVENLRVESLMWGEVDSQVKYDVILGSDIIYQPETVPLLLKTLYGLSSPHTLVLIAYKARALGEHIFFDKLADYSLDCSVVPCSEYPNDFSNSEYKLLKIIRN